MLGGSAVSLAAPDWQASCQPPTHLDRAALVRVVDGDTLIVGNGERVRLIGINAPEQGHRGQPDEPWAVEARQALVRQLAGRSSVWLQQDREPRDRYGRRLAHVYAEPTGPPVAAELLEQGLGWQVAIPPNLKQLSCYAAAEAEAQRQQRGVWSKGHADAVPAAALRQAGFARVELRIVAIRAYADGWWLETDGPLVLQLRRADRHHFDRPEYGVRAGSRGPDPRQWRGEHWRVRGWLVDRSNSPAVRRQGHAPLLLPLRHPAMVEWRSAEGRR